MNNDFYIDKNPIYSKNYLVRDDICLALHGWMPLKVKAILFYIHGMQSHAAWSIETGDYLAKHCIATFILDRRGAGESEGMRGDISNLETLLGDYLSALKKVKCLYPDIPITLFGQSLGGSILAALLCWEKFNIDYNAIVFCASGLGRRHDQLSESEYQALLLDRTDSLCSINLNDEDMTDEKRYIDFIRNDPNCYKKITHRARAVLLEVENMYWGKRKIVKGRPAIFVCPTHDPIVDTKKALRIFMFLSAHQGMVLQFSTNKHYLWFTNQKYNLLRWLTHYVLTSGYTRFDNES